MPDRLQGGQSHDSAAWSGLVDRERGAEGRAQHEAMISGELIEPPTSAYGPRFSSEPTMYPQFDPAVLAKLPRIVTDVVPGSNAEAGLQPGDEIRAPIVLEDVLGDPTAQLTVKVRRGTDALELAYLPRGAAVSGDRWTRVAGVPDGDCAL